MKHFCDDAECNVCVKYCLYNGTCIVYLSLETCLTVCVAFAVLTQNLPQLMWASYTLVTQREGGISLGIYCSLSLNSLPFSMRTEPVYLCTAADNF